MPCKHTYVYIYMLIFTYIYYFVCLYIYISSCINLFFYTCKESDFFANMDFFPAIGWSHWIWIFTPSTVSVWAFLNPAIICVWARMDRSHVCHLATTLRALWNKLVVPGPFLADTCAPSTDIRGCPQPPAAADGSLTELARRMGHSLSHSCVPSWFSALGAG